jgi:hypothetical protein
MGGGHMDFDPSAMPMPPPEGRDVRNVSGGGGGGGGGGGDRRDGPDWDAKKKKKKRGKIDANAKKGRDNRKPWKNWDDD